MMPSGSSCSKEVAAMESPVPSPSPTHHPHLNSNEFRCCFCCHVRTGTILLGLWHLILRIIALGCLLTVLLHPELVGPKFATWTSYTTTSITPLEGTSASSHRVATYVINMPTSASSVVPEITVESSESFTIQRRYRWQLQDIHVALAATICTGAITVMLLYGAIRGRPSYLMPFFCLMVFDFIVSVLAAIDFLLAVPDGHRILDTSKEIPFKEELRRIDPQILYALMVIFAMLFMAVKAYLMGIVWSCYKYLKLQQPGSSYIALSDTESLLPPDYETATKEILILPEYMAPPPPPYSSLEEKDKKDAAA